MWNCSGWLLGMTCGRHWSVFITVACHNAYIACTTYYPAPLLGTASSLLACPLSTSVGLSNSSTFISADDIFICDAGFVASSLLGWLTFSCVHGACRSFVYDCMSHPKDAQVVHTCMCTAGIVLLGLLLLNYWCIGWLGLPMHLWWDSIIIADGMTGCG